MFGLHLQIINEIEYFLVSRFSKHQSVVLIISLKPIAYYTVYKWELLCISVSGERKSRLLYCEKGWLHGSYIHVETKLYTVKFIYTCEHSSPFLTAVGQVRVCERLCQTDDLPVLECVWDPNWKLGLIFETRSFIMFVDGLIIMSLMKWWFPLISRNSQSAHHMIKWNA